MSTADWIVLGTTLSLIVAYGTYKSRGMKTIDSYLLGNRSLPWYQICLSVMATQASAITFLSLPGLGFSKGMGFAQFYLGLPIAMIVLSITFVPIFHKLKVFTAYEFLEERFDLKTRALTATLFLIQRGFSTGITIYAPAMVLSVIFGISTAYTTVIIGSLVLLYTVYGGTKAVSYTQMLQMFVIFAGLLIAGVLTIKLLPQNVGFVKALTIAGKLDRTRAADFSFDWNNQYTVWTGLIGGFFLQLSYFGTDQSQVGRYLTGASVRESRLGLLMNGFVKIPMQFLILMLGVLIFSFYQFHESPVFFNRYEVSRLERNGYANEVAQLKRQHTAIGAERKQASIELADAIDRNDQKSVNELTVRLQGSQARADTVRSNLVKLMKANNESADDNDNNYVFLTFATQYLPKGLIGLLVAIIFLASMGSTASALNSLASTTVVDVYRRMIAKDKSSEHYVRASRVATLAWGLVCIVMALYASKLGNLVEAVNKLGSLFYGTILGIFIVAFYLPKINGKVVFIAAILGELIVAGTAKWGNIAYLWLNFVGCILVVILAFLVRAISGERLK